MDEIFFKIVIPNYNNIAYIKKCLDSILNQTFKDFKIIVVDGMSDDLSDRLCEIYARKNPNKIVCTSSMERCNVDELLDIGCAHQDKSKYVLFIDPVEGLHRNDAFQSLHDKIEDGKTEYLNIDSSKHSCNVLTVKGSQSKFFNDKTFAVMEKCINEAAKTQLQQKPKDNEISQKKEVGKNKVIDEDGCKLRIVCYTCITGGYDQILEPLVPSPNIDFICFSDKQIQSKIWKWRQIPEDLKDLDKIRQQRSIKICPHRYLKEYDRSIWIDGNIQIKNDLNKFIKQYNLEVCPLWIRKHPKRDCIYAEAKECIAQRKAPKEIIDKQIAKYKAVKYPEHNKLVESGIILRKHTAIECQQICNIWLAEVLTESYRDQLSFNYACWAAKFRYGTLIYEPEIIDNKNKYFNWNRFHASQTASSQKKCQLKYDTNYVTIAICNFNTTEMTTDCILSIQKNSGLKRTKFVVLDNSYPNKKFQISNKLNGIDIQLIDNSNGKIIDFNVALKKFSKIPIKANNNGSLKHCLSIQFLLNTCRSRDMLLFDSDTILLKQIDFINPAYVTIADLEKKGDTCSRAPRGKYLSETRFLPFIQYFNCDLIKRKELKYFYPNRIHGGLTFSGNYYDTGASFYEDVINANLPFKKIYYKEYINHLDHGSWRKH